MEFFSSSDVSGGGSGSGSSSRWNPVAEVSVGTLGSEFWPYPGGGQMDFVLLPASGWGAWKWTESCISKS